MSVNQRRVITHLTSVSGFVSKRRRHHGKRDDGFVQHSNVIRVKHLGDGRKAAAEDDRAHRLPGTAVLQERGQQPARFGPVKNNQNCLSRIAVLSGDPNI